MEMGSKHLVVMFTGLDDGLTFIECCHSTLQQLASILVAWFVQPTDLLILYVLFLHVF